MKKLCFLFVSMICFALSGCSSPSKLPEPPFCRVVTEISIQVESAAEPGLSRYSDPQKITKALNYLRQLEHWDRPVADPETYPGARYHITLQFSDGSKKYYEQIAFEYLREPGGSWRMISPEYGVRLALLLVAVPSDAIV